MWYPREEKATQTLVLRCRNCSYAEPAEERRTYENKLKKEITNKLEQLSADVTQDKTLQRTNEVTCAKCGHNEAVLFQAESARTPRAPDVVCTGEGGAPAGNTARVALHRGQHGQFSELGTGSGVVLTRAERGGGLHAVRGGGGRDLRGLAERKDTRERGRGDGARARPRRLFAEREPIESERARGARGRLKISLAGGT